MGAAADLLEQQQNYITELQGKGSTAATNAETTAFLARVNAETPIEVPPVMPAEPPTVVPTTPLTLQEVILTLPTKNYVAPTFEPIPTIGDGLDLPDFSATYEKPSERNTPTDLRPFTAVAPTIKTDFTFPSAPDFVPPLAPTIVDRALPVKGNTSVEAFGVVAPTGLPTAPTDYGSKFRINYRDEGVNARAMAEDVVTTYLNKINPQYTTQMAAIEAQLAKYLAGGTGLSEEVEDAIYARAQAKNDLEAQRVQTAALADTAARGFTMPTGTLYAAMNRARQEAANNNAKAATDIAVAQAEMEQKNLQFAVTTSTGLRTAMLSATLSYMQSLVTLNGQALDYAKSMLNADIEMYNTEVKVYAMRLDLYKAEVAVYEMKTRIAMNAIEIYKAELQAYSATLDADQSKINVYRGLIEAHSMAASLYKTRVDAVISQASLEKMKLELHQLSVQTYSVEVQAKNAEWQGYQASLEGDLMAAKVFMAEVQAYDGQVNAYKARISADVEKVQGQVAKNSALIQKYTAEVGAYEAELKANVAEMGGKVEVQKSKLTQFQGELQQNLAEAENSLAIYKTTSAANIEMARMNLTAQVETKKAGADAFNAAAAIHKSVLEIYSGPATAAASAMNGLASVNESV